MKHSNSIETLKFIQKVEPPKDLFHKILQRIEEQKKRKVKPLWVGIAASVLVLLLVLDVIAVKKQKQALKSSSVQQLLPDIDNSLYYE